MNFIVFDIKKLNKSGFVPIANILASGNKIHAGADRNGRNLLMRYNNNCRKRIVLR